MSIAILKELRRAVSNLDPGEVNAESSRQVHIGLMSPDEAGFTLMEEFLLPAAKTTGKRLLESTALLHRVGATDRSDFDFLLAAPGADAPPHAIEFRPTEPDITVREILVQYD